MRNLVLLLAALVCFACEDEQPRYREVEIPVTALAAVPNQSGPNQYAIDVELTISTPNGCAAKLRAEYAQISENRYQLTGYGIINFEATVCPAVIVSLDTVLQIPVHGSGIYYFAANQAPFEILYDTVDVK